ncbi:MAG: hypothetical protein ACOYKC_09490 [Anaerolineaceae bacterium]|jgi:uncharacterized membrane protein YesL
MRAAQAFDVIVDALKLWWQDWVNQVVVSLAAILLSLTIVLAPAALFGIYKECKDLTHKTRTGLIGFWQGFKSYFRQNLTWGLVNLVVLVILVTNIWFYYKSQFALAPILAFLMIGLGAFWIVWQCFSLACFYLQEEKTLKLAWKNGLAIMLLHPGYALIIGLTILAILVLSFSLYIPLFVGSLPLVALLSLRAVQATLPPPETVPETQE